MKKLPLIASIFAILTLAVVSTSCVPLAVGAAAGYVAAEEGVRVQSPITTNN